MELYGISGGRVHKHDTCINTRAKTRTKNIRNIYAMYGTKFNCPFGTVARNIYSFPFNELNVMKCITV